MGSNEGTGVDVVLAAGLGDDPKGAQPARTKQSKAATVSRTGE
jgi:hypothetical protein